MINYAIKLGDYFQGLNKKEQLFSRVK